MYSGGGPPVYLMWSNMFKPEKSQVAKPVEWRRIGKLFVPYWKEVAQVLACIFAISLLGLVPPLLTMSIIDRAIPHHNFGALLFYVGCMILSAILSGLIGVYQGYVNASMGESILRDLRTELIAHLQKLPLEFFTSTKTGEIMNRVSNDVDSLDDVVTMTLVVIISNIFTLVTTLVTIFILDWRLALLSVIVIPLMVLPLWPVGRQMYLARRKSREKNDEIQSAMQETLSISGITLVKSFGREQVERRRFFNLGNELRNTSIELTMIGRWFLMVITAMVTVGPAIVWIGGGWLAMHKGLTIGAIVTFVALLGRLYTPASALAGVRIQFISALAIFERIFEYLDMKTEDLVRPDAQDLGAIAGQVEFKDVSFSYSTDRQALKDINFVAKPGQMVAFVGVSGAGKTTITHLVPRFYDPQTGSVLIDGHDIRDLNLASLREHIGVVTQETYLFHDSIANNLRYAREDATQDELISAAKTANIHDVIMSLPDGYDTVTGERGHKLSGGERQRLAIARVLLKNPKILILDEATSSLDSHNEALIQAALIPLMKGRTSLVIAHRLSTVLAADIIYVVDRGRIVESGTHADLLAQGGAYSLLYNQQFRNHDQILN
jgi:ATP-binding cassette subfamily B protein